MKKKNDSFNRIHGETQHILLTFLFVEKCFSSDSLSLLSSALSLSFFFFNSGEAFMLFYILILYSDFTFFNDGQNEPFNEKTDTYGKLIIYKKVNIQ